MKHKTQDGDDDKDMMVIMMPMMTKITAMKMMTTTTAMKARILTVKIITALLNG